MLQTKRRRPRVGDDARESDRIERPSFFLSIVVFSLSRSPSSLYFQFQLPLKTGKWGVVTGATDGIGRAYANALAKAGEFFFFLLLRLLRPEKRNRKKLNLDHSTPLPSPPTNHRPQRRPPLAHRVQAHRRGLRDRGQVQGRHQGRRRRLWRRDGRGLRPHRRRRRRPRRRRARQQRRFVVRPRRVLRRDRRRADRRPDRDQHPGDEQGEEFLVFFCAVGFFRGFSASLCFLLFSFLLTSSSKTSLLLLFQTQMTRIVLPGMKQRRRGAVVCIGSAAATVAPSGPLYAVYAG